MVISDTRLKDVLAIFTISVAMVFFDTHLNDIME